VVGPTFADARDTCVEGESGLLGVLPPGCVPHWNRSLGELVLKNGSRFKLFSADQPDRLRGPQHHRAWCDELAAWEYPEALDQLLFGLRLGSSPRVVMTTTPKPTDLIRELVARAKSDVHVTRGRTLDNSAHLPPMALKQLLDRYEGTRLGRQELNGDILDDTEDSIWARCDIDRARVQFCPALQRGVVAIDPAVTSGANSDETGLVAAGLGEDGRYYILADRSARLSPDAWAQKAIALREETGASLVVAEVNEGGELVERILRMADASVPFRAVRAMKSKVERALPVATLYERGLVSHVGSLPKLEDQMCRFTLRGLTGGSPDRVDALVWALIELSRGADQGPGVRMV
jgi:predicted phage terminase large subunit-like protein